MEGDNLYSGTIGKLCYFTNSTGCRTIFCTRHKIAEFPLFPNLGGETFWDSANHGITWQTKDEVLEAIARVYGKMGVGREWLAEPRGFDGRCLEEYVRKTDYEGISKNEDVKLFGDPGSYVLMVRVGARRNMRASFFKNIELCSWLEELHIEETGEGELIESFTRH